MRRLSVAFVLSMAVCLLLSCNHMPREARAVEQVETRPNILFILVDDQRNDTLGCAGHPIIKTPNVDTLAREGVRFENAFVTTSICMVSRASIFSGMTERSIGGSTIQTIDFPNCFPVLLRDAGYRTGFFGKQHVTFPQGNNVALGAMFNTHKPMGRNPYFKKMPDGSKRHVSEIIGDKSVEFLRSQPEDKPFCLYMSFNIAHAEDKDKRPGIGHFPWPKSVDGMYDEIEPLQPRLSDLEYFDTLPPFLKESLNKVRYHWRWDTPEKYRTNMRAYYRMLSGMDGVVGRVLDTLKEEGMAENTVVIYSADNGYYMGDRGLAGKWSHFEESLRVPLIIYDPRLPREKINRVVSPMALNIDIPATILDMAGVVAPSKYQGRSLAPIVSEGRPEDWRKDFSCEYHKPIGKIPKWEGVRTERYVYARYYEQKPPFEFLHDLETDPTQLKNFACDPKYERILAEMRKRCDEYKKECTRPEIEAAKKAAEERKRKRKASN
ncbi:sulfatase [Candidatus Hydrogenedentota bacterium]